jgi:hypothetical protein
LFFKLSKIERLTQKLNVVSFMANFNDINQNLIPQLKAIITASTTLKNSSRFKKLLEVKNSKTKIFFIIKFDFRLYSLLVII